jgi:hypothetical protein
VTDYLKVDSTRLSLAEYWRWKPGAPFALLAAAKLLRWHLPQNVLVPAVPSLAVVDPASRPAGLVSALTDAVTACEARGRMVAFWYTVPAAGAFVGLAAALVSSDDLSVALAVGSQSTSGAYRNVVLGLASRLRNGRYLSTASGRPLFNPPPEVDTRRLPGRSYLQVVDAHDGRVRERRDEVMPCGDAQAIILELQRLQLRANVARGVYVPATALDLERVK